MKRIIATLLLATLIAGCASRTEYGACIGAFDTEKAGLEYHTSARNVVMAFLFAETIVVPVIVVVDETKCPVGRKAQ